MWTMPGGVALYNGPGSGASDVASDIAVDSAGNVYVTGSSNRGFGTDTDYATVKYDPNGNLLWAARYDSFNSLDTAACIAVDSAGNVYVTGSSYNSDTRYDYATIKYDRNGNQLWVVRYDGPESDVATDLAVDPAGDVYVTGSCVGSSTNTDFCTIKYESGSGELLWMRKYNGLANSGDAAVAMAIDPSTGSIYVTGNSSGIATSSDITTVAYRPDGSLLWAGKPGVDAGGAVHYNNDQQNGADDGYDIAIDVAGNVYVVGYSAGVGTGPDYCVLKYDDATGKQSLISVYNGTGNSYDYGNAIAVDATGDVHVAGDSFETETAADIVTIKYKGAADARVLYVIGKVTASGLQSGIENSLTSKLRNTLKSLDAKNADKRQDAIGKLNAFVSECGALGGHKLTSEQANEFISVAKEVIDILNCSR